tara:strand:- start:378 stop:521 length:144 start_codon:yes stop_codon:yes gene_type:complete
MAIKLICFILRANFRAPKINNGGVKSVGWGVDQLIGIFFVYLRKFLH